MKNRLLFYKTKRFTTLFSALVFMLLTTSLKAQSFSGAYDFSSATATNVVSFNYNGTAITNLTVGPLTKVGVATSSSGGNSRASGWDTGSTDGGAAGGNVNTSKYFEFTITAQAGFTISNPTLNFGVGRSATGPRRFQWRSSVDGYIALIPVTTANASVSNIGNVIQTPDANAGYTGNEVSLNATGTTSITFRFYAYGAESAGGTGGLHGNLTFTGTLVPSTSAPTVSNLEPSSVTSTSASLNGNVTVTGGASILTTGSVYALTSENASPIIGGDFVTNLETLSPSAGTGAFSNGTVSSLLVNRQYSYNAYASNSQGTSYGAVNTFYTLAVTPNAPTVGSPTVNSLAVTLDASDDNPSGTQYAIQETGGDYVQADGTLGATAVWRTESEWGTVTVNGLASNTSYTFQVKARNGDGEETGFSATASGTTEANLNPTIEAGALASFGGICVNSSAIESFTFTGYNLTNANVVVGPLSGFTFSTSEEGTYQASLSFTPDLNGEVAETVFVQFTPTAEQNYDGSISITGGGASGVNVSVTASGINTAVLVTTGGSSSISATSAILSGSFEQGCSAVTTSGVQYGLNVDFSGASSIALGGTAVALSPNTLYYFRAFATDATGTVYGATEDFTTLNLSAPVALDGDGETTTSFVANWEVVNGASSYEIDVYRIVGSDPVPVTAVEWNFNDSNVTADAGLNVNLNRALSTNAGTITFVAGFNGVGTGGQAANVSGGWDNGSGTKYWEVSFATTDVTNLKFSSAQYSSGTGPRDFKVQYKLGNDGTYTDVPNSSTTVGGTTSNWTGVLANVSLPSSCDNQPLVFLRWIMTSNVQSSGTGNVATTGTSRIDNIVVAGEQGGLSTTYILQNENVGNVTSYLVSNLTPGTEYFYVVRAISTNSTSPNSSPITVITAAAPPTFGSISQNASVCDGQTATFNVSGLLLNETTILNYQIGDGVVTQVEVTAGPDNSGTFQLALGFALNGLDLTVLSVERPGIVGSLVEVTTNNVVTLAVTEQPTWYADVDGDGYGNDEDTLQACDQPDGYVDVAGDCDDSNDEVNPGATEVCFDGVDSNCNGNDSDACPVVVNITNYCGGTLPIINAIIKCNVPNLSAYGSGFTLGYRFRVTNTATNTTVELDRSVPNFNLTMTSIFTYNTVFTIQVAAIVNGHVQSYLGDTCTVTTPAIPTNQVVSTTCGATLAALNSRIHVSTVFGSIHYRFRIALSDAPTTYEYVEVPFASMRLNNLVDLPLNFGKTYLIAVQSLVDINGEEVYSDFGAECAVSTPSVATISVSANQCGQELEAVNSRIFINSVPNATLYRYRVALASNPSITEDITSTFTSFRLSSLTGTVPLLHASDYLVSVQVEVTIDGNVFPSSFSTPCIISTPGFPESGIQASQCSNGDEENEGPYAVSSLDEQLYAEFVSGASYRFLLERYSGDVLLYSQEIIMPINWVKLSQFNTLSPLEAGATYSISVGLNINGEGPYGKDCSLIVPGASSFTRVSNSAQETTKQSELFTAMAYPNPFQNSFNLDIKANATAPINIVVYDMMGRLLESNTITIDQANNTKIGANYPAGVYNVVVSQGESVQSVRVIKQ